MHDGRPDIDVRRPVPVSGSAAYGVVASFHGWSSQESPTTWFTYDATAPTAAASASGAPNPSGWIRAASSTVTVSATDTGSGVASVSYRVDGGAWTTVAGTSTSFSVAAQGTAVVSYYATDGAGNVAATKTLAVKLDNVAPTVTVAYPPAGAASSSRWDGNCRSASDAVADGLCGSSADETSGVSAVEYLLSRTPTCGGPTVCWNSKRTSWKKGACKKYRVADRGPSGIASWYVALPASDLGAGGFELRVLVTDAAGNGSDVAAATRTFTVGP